MKLHEELINCRKCGALIRLEDTSCPMCNAKQKNQGRGDRHKTRDTKKTPIVLFGCLSVILVFVVLFILLRGNDQTEIAKDRLIFVDLSENDIFLLNHPRNLQTITSFITENGIYFVGEPSFFPAGSVLLRTSDYFETSEVIGVLGDWFIDTIHVVENGIYYTTFGDLYYHCLIDGESTKITDEIRDKVIIDHLVFHQRYVHEDGPLYVFDLTSGARSVLIDDEVRNFVIDPENERIIYSVSGGVVEPTDLFQADLTGENITLVRHDSWDFTVGNNLMAFEYGFNDLIRNFATGGMMTLEIEPRLRLGSSVFVGEYLVATCRDGYLWVIDTNTQEYHQLTDPVFSFTVLGNQVVYALRENRDVVHMTNLDGQSRKIVSILGVND